MSKRQLLRMLEREREAHAAERARLVDQLCNLAGSPWTLPPRPLTAEPQPELTEVDERILALGPLEEL